MFVTSAEKMDYIESGIEGISLCNLWDNGTGGGTSIVCLSADAYFPKHAHLGWEQAYVLSGEVKLGDVTVKTGDYLFADIGDIHDARAITDSKLLVFTEKGIDILDEG